MKICQYRAEIFNKMGSFEVSIGCYLSFQSSHQNDSCYRSLVKICQHRAEIFNKMCSFEVSIRLLPLILIISSKESILLLWGYYPLHRGSSGTGPTAVDREQKTLADVCNGIYSGLRYDPQ